ncbi:MAG: hypothetical protein ACR2I2_14845 [Bryobacteraceae bacterium]
MRRLINSLRCTFLTLVSALAGYGQIAGPNVNMVSGKTLPGGDPFLQRQKRAVDNRLHPQSAASPGGRQRL